MKTLKVIPRCGHCMAAYPAPGEGVRRVLKGQADWEYDHYTSCDHSDDLMHPTESRELSHPILTPYFPHLYT